ncbi:MAG: hypothetical protein RLZZ385_2667 [Pseudomonadota bacterium]|jgi:hypothetical protein
MEQHAIAGLYAAAKRKTWNVDTSLDWSARVLHQDFPVAPQLNPFAGLPAYEALPREHRVRIAWRLHAAEINDLLRGESAALTLCAQLLSLTDDMAQRLFLSAQVSDEARHVEFFSRYQDRVVGFRANPPSGPTPSLEQLLVRAIGSRSPLRKLLVCQVIIESLALTRFRLLRRLARVPVLVQALGLIAADEARHVRFGTVCLGSDGIRLSRRQRRAAAAFVHRAVARLAADLDIPLGIGREQGFDDLGLLQHLRRNRVQGLGAAWRGELAQTLDAAGLQFRTGDARQ